MIWVTDKSKSRHRGKEAPRHGTVENWFHFAVVLFSLSCFFSFRPPFFHEGGGTESSPLMRRCNSHRVRKDNRAMNLVFHVFCAARKKREIPQS